MAPVSSMTGFARGSRPAAEAQDGREEQQAGGGWTLTIKSVNHRFLDLHLRLPAGLESLEMQLRRLLKAELVRGHVEVMLTVEGGARARAQFDAAALSAYLAAFRAAAREHGLIQEPDLNALVGLPGVVRGGGTGAQEGEAAQALEASVMAQAPAILSAFKRMRAEEGAALAADLHSIMARMEGHVEAAEAMLPVLERAHFGRMRSRLEALLGPEAGIDRERLLQEAAMLAEKSDVSEEMARLRMHIAQFRAQLETGGEVGKKLDFLLQEMNRETNTLLSKMAGGGGEAARVTELGLQMKSEIEKAREQVQNVE